MVQCCCVGYIEVVDHLLCAESKLYFTGRNFLRLLKNLPFTPSLAFPLFLSSFPLQTKTASQSHKHTQNHSSLKTVSTSTHHILLANAVTCARLKSNMLFRAILKNQNLQKYMHQFSTFLVLQRNIILIFKTTICDVHEDDFDWLFNTKDCKSRNRKFI